MSFFPPGCSVENTFWPGTVFGELGSDTPDPSCAADCVRLLIRFPDRGVLLCTPLFSMNVKFGVCFTSAGVPAVFPEEPEPPLFWELVVGVPVPLLLLLEVDAAAEEAADVAAAFVDRFLLAGWRACFGLSLAVDAFLLEGAAAFGPVPVAAIVAAGVRGVLAIALGVDTLLK